MLGKKWIGFMADYQRKVESVIIGQLSIVDGRAIGDTSDLLNIRFEAPVAPVEPANPPETSA